MDAMHDTFVLLVRHRERLTDDGPSRLLYRTATNVCLNRIRSRKRHPEDADDDLLQRIAALEEPGERTLARDLLQRVFAREPVSTRTLAVLHLLDGLTLEETAEHVGLSVSGVRKRLRSLRARLPELSAGGTS